MTAKLTRVTHKIAIKLHLVADSCTICSSRSRRQVRKFWIHPRICDTRVYITYILISVLLSKAQ